MILRRISKGIRQQDWLTVVVEVLIVVVGIFVALQVDDWNNARKDRALEQEYLERLHADMVGSLADQRAYENWDEERIATQDIVLKALRAGVLAEEDRPAFDRGLMLLAYFTPLRQRWTTVEELRSTGNLDILQDLELRDLIGLTEANFKRHNELMARAVTANFRHRIWIEHKFEAIENTLGTESEVVLRYDFEALVADPEFRHVVSHLAARGRFIRLWQSVHIRDLEALRDKLVALLGIEAEIGQ